LLLHVHDGDGFAVLAPLILWAVTKRVSCPIGTPVRVEKAMTSWIGWEDTYNTKLALLWDKIKLFW